METALDAAVAGDLEKLRAIYEAGGVAALSAADATGWVPAHYAAQNGHVSALRLLHFFGAGATLSAAALSRSSSRRGYTPAHAAAHHRHPGVLRALHELGAGAALSAATADGKTPAHYAAWKGSRDSLRVLHELGDRLTLSAADASGCTPAHYAAWDGFDDALRVLHELGAGATFLAADNTGMHPAHLAAESGQDSTLRLLNELGAGPSLLATDDDGRTPAYYATHNDHHGCEFSSTLRVLYELGAGATFLVADREGRTPAHGVAENGFDVSLRVLHECGAGATLSAADEKGWTPAHYAANEEPFEYTCTPDALRVLHELGATLSAVNADGMTPAHCAARAGHDDSLRVLAAAGVNLTIFTGHPWPSHDSPAQLARKSGKHKTAAWLESAEGCPTFRVAVKLCGPTEAVRCDHWTGELTLTERFWRCPCDLARGRPRALVTVLRRALRDGAVDPDDCIGQVRATMRAAAASGIPALAALVKLAFGLGEAVDPRHRFSGWRPANHWLHHPRFRAAVQATLTVERRLRLPETRLNLPHLPPELWHAILAQLSRQHFP